MLECDSRRTIQNSGVMIVDEGSEGGSIDNNFYSALDEVLHWTMCSAIQVLMVRHRQQQKL